MFDPFLRTHAAAHGSVFVPFTADAYPRYIQGVPRLEGARAFLASRGITLPYDDLRGLAMSQEEFFRSEVCCHRAGVLEQFDVILDGLDAPGVDLPEHLDVHLILEAATRLETSPLLTAVVEDSAAAVKAARCGGFGAVIGVDRTEWSAALGSRGADLVVAGLFDLRLRGVRAAGSA